MKNLIAFLAATLIAATAAATLTAATAAAETGKYTLHGDVLVTVAVAGDCASITWPKGTVTSTCSYDQTTQTDIQPGDTFGASITSPEGGVSCSVVDLTTGDTIWNDSALPGQAADCIRKAV